MQKLSRNLVVTESSVADCFGTIAASQEDKMAKCQGKTKAGKACQASATAGGLCFFHANPSQAREWGRVGGRKNRRPEPELPTATNMTLAQLNEVLVETLHGVRSKRLSPRCAAAVVQLCTALRQTLPQAELEARVARLEERMAERTADATAPETTEATPVNGGAPPLPTQSPSAETTHSS